MQEVTPWPTSFDVSEPVARVLVDGQEVNVESVSVSSELDSAMPDRVAAGGGGVVAATGDASIVRADDVEGAGFNPWGDAQQFVNASEVVVEAGYRDEESREIGCVRQITGQVDSVDGSALSGSVGLGFVDYTPLLDRDITIEPLMEQYPPLQDWGPLRGAGLSSTYITDRVLRHCGLYATPPMVPGSMLAAPLMGSAVPERGTMVSGFSTVDPNTAVKFEPAPWGMALADGIVSYRPNLSSRHGRLTATLHISFHRTTRVDAVSSGYINAYWGSGRENGVRVQIASDGRILVFYLTDGAVTSSAVAALSIRDVRESEAFTILVAPDGRATIYGSNGSSATGTGTLPPLSVSTSMSEIVVSVPSRSHPIGGLQVAATTTRNEGFSRTAHLDPPAHYHSLRAFPFQYQVNCLALLKEQAEAELAAMWVDEFGHFQWRNRHRLRDSAPKGTLTSLDNLLDFPWSVPVRSVYSRVEINHDLPTITRRLVPSITVSDSRGSVLSNGDTEDKFIEPSANEDWHLIATPQWMGGTIDYAELRRGRGSYRGGIIVDDEDNERIAYSSRLHQTWEQINPQRWLVHSEAIGLTANESIEQNFRDRPDLYGRFAEENLPIIRAKGLVQWDDDKTIGALRGPLLAPVHVHRVGPWIQDPAELRSLADWLADHLTKPEPVLRNIPIVPDPRIQLGDVFWLEDRSAYHLRLRVVVMGKTLRYQASDSSREMTQEITCRVLAVERLGVRYDELETAWEGRDYAAFETAWAGQDYDALEADPLDRS